MGPGKHGTSPLRDLNGSVAWRSDESGPKLFQIARSFTWNRIIHWVAKITAVFVERHRVVEGKSLPENQKYRRMHWPLLSTNLTELKALTA